MTTTQTVHDTLRTLEEGAVGFDRDNDKDRGERGTLTHARWWVHYYVSNYGAVPGQPLADVLQAEYGVSDSKARSLIREAANEGLLIRQGAGSATKYLTPEARDAKDEEARRVSAELTAKASHARSLGLAVLTIWGGTRYSANESRDDARDAALTQSGKVCVKLKVESSVDDLIALLEPGSSALPTQEEVLPLDV